MDIDWSSCEIPEDSQDEIESLVAIYGDELRLDFTSNSVSLEMDIIPCESEIKMSDQDSRVFFCLGITLSANSSALELRKCKGNFF